MAGSIISWAARDNYLETRSSPKYNVQQIPDRWIPTPPAYMDGIEPAWRDIRTMVIDSAQQFRPELPTQYSLETDSKFYKEVLAVYNTAKNLDQEQKEIASFWDCNPYVMNITGHVMLATKKITPGGHWMEISSIAIEQSKVDMVKAAETYARVSISLFDAFISCWDEKYRSNLVRPETIINNHIDGNWKPLLQTPPFPEYTSGHSVISRSAAVCLTSLYGDHYDFVDDSEKVFGLPSREFKSFYHASEEAAVSRLYGGIHYMPAIENGVGQGQNIGKYIVGKLMTK